MNGHGETLFEQDKGGTFTCVSVIGELDLLSASSLLAELEALIQRERKDLHLDLSHVSFIDSAGLSVLVRIWKRLRQDGRELRISKVSDWTRHLFTKLKLDFFLPPPELEATNRPHDEPPEAVVASDGSALVLSGFSAPLSRLSVSQADRLTMILNLALGRAAEALSELVSEKLEMEVRQVAVRSVHELAENLSGLVHFNVAAVHHEVLGALSGNALLIQTETSGALLSEILTRFQSPPPSRSDPRHEGSVLGARLEAADREVLNEIGNILLHAFATSLGENLGLFVKLRSPQIYVQNLQLILERILQKRAGIEWGVVIATRFRLRKGEAMAEVSGYLMMLLGTSSLDTLLDALSKAPPTGP